MGGCSEEGKKSKGRAIGGFVIERKKGWGKKGSKLMHKEEEEIVMSEIIKGTEKWKVMSIYNRKDWKGLEQKIESLIEEKKDERLIINGDFNIRIGELGNVSEIDIEKRSKDKIIGNGGRNFIDWIQKKGWYMMNETIKGNWKESLHRS